MIFTGKHPRFYLSHPDLKLLNFSTTIYFKRVSDDDTNWGGLSIGVRTTPDGHGKDNCKSMAYYARIRNDGSTDFTKELEHPQVSSINNKDIWNGKRLPYNKWIGAKLKVYNIGNYVKLELYRDLIDGKGFTLINETLDIGNWNSPLEKCNIPNNYIINNGHGSMLIRNTNVKTFYYKNMSIDLII